MANYTNGPWFYKKNGQTYYVDASIGGGMLQEVAACGPTENWEHQEANARLVSAAPDLLEALQELVSIAEAWEIDAGRARAAIKKATGQ